MDRNAPYVVTIVKWRPIPGSTMRGPRGFDLFFQKKLEAVAFAKQAKQGKWHAHVVQRYSMKFLDGQLWEYRERCVFGNPDGWL